MTENVSISQSILTSLGGGSGIDIFKLARDLADVEKEPKQLAIQASIDKSEASISGYAAISFQLGVVKNAFESFDDVSELATSKSTSSNPDVVEMTTISGETLRGTYDINVSQVATEQRTVSNTFSSVDQSLNDESFDLTISVGNQSVTNHTVTIDTATPDGIVTSINNANIGVTANLVRLGNSSDEYQIMLQGDKGSEGAFTISSSVDLGFGESSNTLQAAGNAQFVFNGLSIERETNDISDLVNGATLTIKAPSEETVSVRVSSGENLLKGSLQNMITAYNDLKGIMDALVDSDSEIENGGALVNDYSGVRFVEQQIRDAIFDDAETASGSISSLRDLGVSTDKNGKLVLDDEVFDDALTNDYDDVKMMLTAGTDNQSEFTATSKGLAQSVILKVDELVGNDGIIADRKENAESAVEDYQEDMIKLEERMELLYERYLAQFTAMESLVREMNNTRDYLEDQFEMMANVGKK
jgi:flagellar hook-associated protein 2